MEGESKMAVSVLNRLVALASVAGAVCGSLVSARADDVEEFYRGKRLTVVIGYEPGGGYDIYARLVGKHIAEHLPGKPSFVPQNMPGAGSRKAANWLYEIAPRDGTTIATINNGAALDQALGEPSVQYDAAKFNWIGNPIVDAGVTFTLRSSPYQTIEDVKSKGGMICAGTGAASPSVTYPHILNELVGTKIKVIGGYPGTAQATLAMQRNEIHCIAGSTWTSVRSTNKDMFVSNQLAFLMQWGRIKNPEIATYMGHEVPSIFDYAKSETDQKVMALLMSSSDIGRPILAPPAVPSDRVAALRKAFDDSMKDPAFVDDIKKAGLDLAPIQGQKMQDLVAVTAGITAEVLARTRALLRPPDDYSEKK
jgi:tripartite-type tricarboxylate transporter receptor subunit TctC